MLHSALNRIVQSLLPAACVEPFALPDLPIQLHLLNADFPRERIPQDLALQLMEEPFYWAFCWASGAVLARYLLDHPALVAGKRVLDFGCGSGVVAIAAAKAGAAEVIACDIDPVALTATEANAGLNQVELTLSDDFDGIGGDFDIIVAADVLYDRANLPWLAKFQERAATVLVGDSRIRQFDFPGYRKVCEVDACTLPDLDESAEFRKVSIYTAGSPGGFA
jgi:predicted nicotinamide N-methyase